MATLGLSGHQYALSPCIKVIVGTQPHCRTYHLHKDLLQSKSGFFRGCLRNKFPETQRGQVSLPDDDPDAFDYVVDWLYGGTLKDDFCTRQVTWINIYILADKLLCSQLKNGLVDLIQEFYRANYVQYTHMPILINKGLERSSLMRFMVEQAGTELAWSYDECMERNGWASFYALGEEISGQIINEMGRVSRSREQHVSPASKSGCEYHEHDEESAKDKCKRWNTGGLIRVY